MYEIIALAAICPQLSGLYSCPYNGSYTDLKISQTLVTKSPVRVEYSFDYTRIPGDPDVFTASATVTGDRDPFGWSNRCERGRVVSISEDGSMKSELFVDKDKNLVRTLNDQTAQICFRHSSG